MNEILFSVVIAVYNRPQELSELLRTIENQYFKDFEVIVVDDGSEQKSDEVARFASFPCRYFYTENRGPGAARNFGAQKARGSYLIFLDSDTLLPQTYLALLQIQLEAQPLDFFGGPDQAADDFLPLQKAIDYTMTSRLTTGGIRGGKAEDDEFQPRSFNMGIQKALFDSLGGFSQMRVSEDIDLAIRVRKAGVKGTLIPDAWVCHQRKTTLYSFFKQTYAFGHGRIFLNFFHRTGLRWTFWLPSLYVLAVLSIVWALLLGELFPLVLLAAYWALVGLGAARKMNSGYVGLLAVAAVNVQFFGYGMGFLYAYGRVGLLKQAPQRAFPRFFKS